MSSKIDDRDEKIAQDYTVLPTTKLNDTFEVTMFRTPNILLRELEHVFSSITSKDSVLAVLTCQHSDVDLVKYGDDADVEKDKLLADFVDFAKGYCNDLIERGYWADYIE